MPARFIIGPAGSGKTFCCLREIRAELLAGAAGAPLVFLAPKQATFQIEHQLLEDGSLPGYTRLQILSFERLAEMILEQAGGAPAALLSDEGRVMVLRALLARRQADLQVFRASARLPGFARQLSGELGLLQRHHVSAGQLAKLAGQDSLPESLRGKLRDLALLLEDYLAWLKKQDLEDSQSLLDLAAEALRRKDFLWRLGGLWLDGFAELTPQELELLAAVAPRCERFTAAFCLEQAPEGDLPWLSTWCAVGQTFRRCHARVEAATGERPELVVLPRDHARGRFAGAPELAHLEHYWSHPNPPAPPAAGHAPAVRLAPCANAEAEAVLAAREIRRHARNGGRYREVAVLMRRLDSHAHRLRRIFHRYDIPCFIDRREAVAHHPLAELTRYALRLAAWNWRTADWLGALKSGLVPAPEADIDSLENAALELGWEGQDWLRPLVFGDAEVSGEKERLENLRERWVAPFRNFHSALGGGKSGVDGPRLAAALRGLWAELEADKTLARWAEAAGAETLPGGLAPPAHATVWGQMQDWLDNLERAFAGQPLPLTDWLAVVEAGLSGLTVGVIPPALDQVLIGAVDRSRNPDLKLAILPGFNEGLFPAPPPAPGLLAEEERQALEGQHLSLGLNRRQQIGLERYLGYIACTRATRQLVVTWAESDDAGEKLNPSPFLDRLRRLAASAPEPVFSGAGDWREAEHFCEVLGGLARPGHPLEPWADEQLSRLALLRHYAPDESIPPALAEKLYGPALKTSVSAMEKFGMCPFRFFATAGLGAKERQLFEVDPLRIGSLQHDVLALFHERLEREGGKWRDLTPDQARARIAEAAQEVARGFNQGLFRASARNRFTLETLTRALQDFIAVNVAWMSSYRFDPRAVELGFGDGQGLPAWQLDLGEGHSLEFRGRIDRIDTSASPDADFAWVVVIDYKSSARQLDPLLLAHGIQMQLPAYLSVLRHLPAARERLGVRELRPAGVFYANLRGSLSGAPNRGEALRNPEAARREAYRHDGRFDLAALRLLDANPDEPSGQFAYRLKKDGNPYANSPQPMLTEAFHRLLDQAEANLLRMGREIYQGRAAVDPYQKKAEVACGQCECRPICRIDPWTHVYRRLAATDAQY